jgi:phospholipid/cholesterol/gamma-HCH transport system substrate-binding protein
MTKEIHKPTLVLTIALWIGAVVVFVIFNNAFGGPQIGFSNPYRISAYAADSQNLLTKSLVLERGVQVGYVDGVSLSGNHARFTIAISRQYAPIYRDATVSIGHRTLFGEAYVEVSPGQPAAGALPDNAALPAGAFVPVVNIDQALQVLNAPARRHVISLASTASSVNRDPMAARLLGGTLGGIGDTLAQLRRLSAELDDQHGNITRVVSSGRVVLDVLGSREQGIATLIHGARQTLQGLTVNDAALREGLKQIPPLLGSTRSTLAAALPLLHDAGPVVSGLTHAAPALSSTLGNLPPVASSANAFLSGLPAFRRAAIPVLHLLRGVSDAAGPAISALQPTLQNLIPVIQYLAPYNREMVAFVMNLGASTHVWNSNGTADSHAVAAQQLTGNNKFGVLSGFTWPRFQAVLEPATLLGLHDPAVSANPYPPPNTSAAPFVPGEYHRLEPYALPYRAVGHRGAPARQHKPR